jgi:hypothetical protein
MEYTGFHDWLSSHIDQYLSGNSSALAEALAPYSDITALHALLDSAVQQEDWLGSIAKYSYLHPNGFAKIVLISTDRFQLRLHIWRPFDPPQTITENIHNHRWDFSSVLLTGGYRYQEFAPAPNGTTFHAYGYRSQRGISSYSLASAGQRVLGCSFDAYLQTGSSYTLSADVLHRVISDPRRTTATLVLQGPSTRDSVEVLAEASLDTGPALPLHRFSEAAVIQCVSDLTREFKDR